MDAKTLKSKLNGAALEQLAALSLESLLDTPVESVIGEDSVVRITRVALGGWLESSESLEAFNRLTERVVNELSGNREAIKDVVAREVREAVREVVSRPFSPDRKVVLSIIDRGPARELVRQLLLDAILDFGKKISAPMSGMAKGLGSLARMATETVKSRGGGLGSLVGAVSGEVERQLEKRAVEFVDAALGGIFGQIADAVSNPERAAEAAELRLSMFDGVMSLTLQQLSRELMNADLPGSAQTLRESLKRWLASSEAEPQLKSLTQFALKAAPQRTMRAWLAEWGMLETMRPLMHEQILARMKDVVATDAFSAWLNGLLTE